MSIITCGPKCTTEQKNYGFECGDPQLSYIGAVLGTYERNGYDDSDFIAIVWDGERIRHIRYASTRGWTYHNGVKVDATPEVIAAATEWARDRYITAAIADAETERVTPSKGRMVRSLTKSGKNKGVTGEVRWYGVDDYASARTYGYYAPMKVGIKVEGEAKLRYVPANKVEVIDPQPINLHSIVARAIRFTPDGPHGSGWMNADPILNAALCRAA